MSEEVTGLGARDALRASVSYVSLLRAAGSARGGGTVVRGYFLMLVSALLFFESLAHVSVFSQSLLPTPLPGCTWCTWNVGQDTNG